MIYFDGEENIDMMSSYKDSNENKLQIVIDILKTQIDQYGLVSNTIKPEPALKRWEKIQKLTSNERKLSIQFQQIRQEIQRYERKFEKLLNKKLKLMKAQIHEDREKLNVVKQRYQELNVQFLMAPYQIKQVKQSKSKKPQKQIKVKVVKSKFKQKNVQFNKPIKIEQNKKLGERKIRFIKNGNGDQALMDLAKIVKPVTTNTRECKIILQKLTEEQVRQYMSEGESQRRKIRTIRLRQDAQEKVNQNGKSAAQLNWHIKIPKAVIEESEIEKCSSSQKNVNYLE